MYDLIKLFNEHNDEEICKYIEQNIHLVNMMDDFGQYPLHQSITTNKELVFKTLLLNKSDCNVKNRANQSPLMVAYILKNFIFFDELLLRGAFDDEVLTRCQYDKNIKFFKRIYNCKSLKNIMTPLHLAAASNNLNELISILECKDYFVDINDNSYDGNTPLHLASMNGHTQIVTELINRKALINLLNNTRQTPLIVSVIFKRIEVIKILLPLLTKEEIDFLDGSSRSALSYAVSNDNSEYKEPDALLLNTEISKLLVEADADIVGLNYMANHNSKNSDDNFNIIFYPSSPVILAVINNNIESFKIFLDNGLDVNLCDPNGKTLLMYASENGSFEIAKLLVEHDADIFITYSERNLMAMYFADLNNHDEIVQLFLDNGYNPNIHGELFIP